MIKLNQVGIIIKLSSMTTVSEFTESSVWSPVLYLTQPRFINISRIIEERNDQNEE
jgi:hypothetical protein